jgi:exosome complex exonuclease DIS3/RRP44
MTPDAEIVHTGFHKTLIRSRKSMSYGEAQARMDNPNLTDELTESVRNLNKLAKILKKRRIEAGALTLASGEVRFIKDEETHDPVDLEMYESKETNSLVEEFMLLASALVVISVTPFSVL